MTAFSPKQFAELTGSLNSIASNFHDRTALTLTGDEFVDAFINPDHVEKLKDVEELVGMVASGSFNSEITVGAELATVSVWFAGKQPIIVPRYTRHGLQPTASQAVRDKIEGWINERVRIGVAFGDAHDALRYLNDTCGDAKAVAVMLPCLVTIMSTVSTDPDSKTTQRARKIAAKSSFGTLPALPLEVKNRLREIAAVVNGAAMTTDAPLSSSGLRSGSALIKMSGHNGSRPHLFHGAQAVGSFL